MLAFISLGGLTAAGLALAFFTGRDMRDDARKDDAVRRLFIDPTRRDDR